MSQLRRAALQIADIWRAWPWSKRASVLVGGLGSLAVFATLITWTTQTEYVPLMTQLAPTDAAAITRELDASQTSYRLEADGTAILVPSDSVHRLRLRLASAGLPKGGGIGFELFDAQSFGTSRFGERLNYLRAIQGELQRTIRQMESVVDARVHVVIPEERLFRRERAEPRASVTVQLNRGRALHRAEVDAIVHLVSSSVAGLHPKSVTVVDTAGQVLAKGGEETGGIDEQIDRQNKMERSIEGRLTETLERVVGAGNAKVQVSALMDFTHRERTIEKYDPDNFVLRSEQVSEEQSGSTEKEAVGVPGARSNLTGDDGTDQVRGASRRSETRNYEIDKVISHEVEPVARIERLSVAVVVNGRPVTGEDGATSYVPRSEEEIAQISALARTAVGLDDERGDTLEVRSIIFPELDAGSGDVRPAWVSYLPVLWKPVVALLLLGLVALVLLRRTQRPTPLLLDPPRTVRDLEAAYDMTQATPIAEPADARPALMEPPPRPDPTRAAAVIKGWVSEA